MEESVLFPLEKISLKLGTVLIETVLSEKFLYLLENSLTLQNSISKGLGTICAKMRPYGLWRTSYHRIFFKDYIIPFYIFSCYQSSSSIFSLNQGCFFWFSLLKKQSMSLPSNFNCQKCWSDLTVSSMFEEKCTIEKHG